MPFHNEIKSWIEKDQNKKQYHEERRKEKDVKEKKYQYKQKKYAPSKPMKNFNYKDESEMIKEVIHYILLTLKIQNKEKCFYCGKAYVKGSKAFKEHEAKCFEKPIPLHLVHLLPQPKVYVGVIYPEQSSL